MASTVLRQIDNNGYSDFDIQGGKSGTTIRAGRCWATLALKNSKKYILVAMGAPFDYENEAEVRCLTR